MDRNLKQHNAYDLYKVLHVLYTKKSWSSTIYYAIIEHFLNKNFSKE
jgi:hypothetical protein